MRQEVDKWRALKNWNDWRITPETARLLQHWRRHPFSSVRSFFCRVEAAEPIIWCNEVAPQIRKIGQTFLENLANATPELMRAPLKLATGAGQAHSGPGHGMRKTVARSISRGTRR
jgi:type III restriction enzyme